MVKISIELSDIIKNESLLSSIRNIFFPLIKNKIITGYNVYPSYPITGGFPYFIHYLHSDLTGRHKHYRELADILEERGFLKKAIRINDKLIDTHEVIDRQADYIAMASWKNPQKMRYFTPDCREITKKEAKKRREVIGEGEQYDLIIAVNNDNELKDLRRIFKKNASKFIIDRFGRVVEDKNQEPRKNKNPVYNAWEVPLLVCTSNNDIKPRYLTDFLKVRQFNITYSTDPGVSVIISSLVRNNAGKFRQFLTEKNFDFAESKKYALRVFVEDYIDS